MFIEKFSPRFCDTDALGHISNTAIPQWFEGARTPVFKLFSPELDLAQWPLILAKIEIDFLQQVFYQYDVEVKTYISRLGNSSFDVTQELWQQNQKVATGKAVMVHFCFQSQRAVVIDGELKQRVLAHFHSAAST